MEGTGEIEEPMTKLPRKVVSHPISGVHMDNVGHIPIYIEAKNASKCRMPGCISKAKTMCNKCHLYLCIAKKLFSKISTKINDNTS
jgi:hypothetical protein